MTNNEILKIEKKNPNNPKEPPTVLGIFPSASKQLAMTASLVNAIVYDQLAELTELDPTMEHNLIEEFDKLKENSNMVACYECRTTNNKRCMVVHLVEK